MGRDIYRKIKKVRVNLEKAITEKGLNSKEVRELSNKIDELINEYEKSIKIVEYPEGSNILEYYESSYRELKKITNEYSKFPIVKEWNHYAKNNDLMSHASLEYVSTLDWNYLRIKVERELNFKIVNRS